MAKLTLIPDVLALNPGLAVAQAPRAEVYDSDLERRAVAEWLPGQPAQRWYYHPFMLYLPSGRYTPDFLLVMRDRSLACVEVKGWNKNLRADRRKFKEAAKFHPWTRWLWLTWDAGWQEEWM